MFLSFNKHITRNMLGKTPQALKHKELTMGTHTEDRILKGTSPKILQSNKYQTKVIPLDNLQEIGKALTRLNEKPYNGKHLSLRVDGTNSTKKAIQKIMEVVPELFRKGRLSSLYIQTAQP